MLHIIGTWGDRGPLIGNWQAQSKSTLQRLVAELWQGTPVKRSSVTTHAFSLTGDTLFPFTSDGPDSRSIPFRFLSFHVHGESWKTDTYSMLHSLTSRYRNGIYSQADHCCPAISPQPFCIRCLIPYQTLRMNAAIRVGTPDLMLRKLHSACLACRHFKTRRC